jgi:hypothetical protein
LANIALFWPGHGMEIDRYTCGLNGMEDDTGGVCVFGGKQRLDKFSSMRVLSKQDTGQ